MWNEPSISDLVKLPPIGSTEEVTGLDKLIGMHFFLHGSDWYAAEYDVADREFFGYAILNSDLHNSEWGYFSFDELRDLKVKGIEVDRDLYWETRKASEVPKIVAAYGLIKRHKA